ncbi:MAG: hypothetical protein ACLFPF_01380 [Halanaerobiales bacterium]
MLDRTGVLKKLLEVRRFIYKKENRKNNPPSLEDVKIRKELDDIIRQIIGDGFSIEDKEYIDRILLKAICDDITIDMAVVAIKEIIMTYYQKNKSSNNQYDKGKEKKLAAYYQERYR